MPWLAEAINTGLEQTGVSACHVTQQTDKLLFGNEKAV